MSEELYQEFRVPFLIGSGKYNTEAYIYFLALHLLLVINLYVYIILKDIFNLRVSLSFRKSLLIEHMRCFVTMSHLIQLKSFFAYFLIYTSRSKVVSVLCSTCRKGHSSRLKVDDGTLKCEDELTFKVNVLN